MQKGFIQIPILILILLGTAVVGGGGYYAVKEISNNSAVEVEQEQTEIVTPNESNIAETEFSDTEVFEDKSTDETTQANTESSVKSPDVSPAINTVPVKTIPAVVNEIPQSELPKKYSLDQSTEIICEEAEEQDDSDSLIKDILSLCDAALNNKFESTSDFGETVEEINDGWDKWETKENQKELDAILKEQALKQAEQDARDDKDDKSEEDEVEQNEEDVEDTQPELSYNDLHCPTIVRLEDNQGNESSAGLTYLKGSLSASAIDTLRVTIIAEDPNGDSVEYRFSPSSFSKNNPNLVQWTSNNSYEVLGENLLTGGNRTLFAAIDDGDDYSCIGANYDVSIKFTYDIAP